MGQKGTVFVGLSGGVDSSVAAARLKARGYNVVGVFIKVWHPEWLSCNWEQERLDAMRVAARLDIPFLTCDAERAYKDGVANHFIQEYQAGRTPNPDVLCNKEVKFGAFLRFADAHKADFVATGHYAQKITTETGFELHRGVDTNKDQSYFLWTLTQAQLKRILLPVGDTKKEDIRKEAAKAGLITSEKKDSQGICFLGHIDIKEFLGHYTELVPGPVENERGDVIGEHDGALIYTIGQRHGFTLHNKTPESQPHYVSRKNMERNTIVVSTHPPKADKTNHIHLHTCNWIGEQPQANSNFELQTRYRQSPNPARFTELNNDTATLEPQQPIDAFASGQSAVCYLGQRCLGGGIIG
ncbi:MAG: tRNA 2-thiouridine(34) synthase MnmA [Bacteroidetes bacterium]|nr:MAG: tRNA 2-thiouridine(34) synthase MnmA [Bacteroidota bacterium]